MPVISNIGCGTVGIGRDEMLQGADGPETLPRSLPFSERQMRILRPIVQAPVRAVLNSKECANYFKNAGYRQP